MESNQIKAPIEGSDAPSEEVLEPTMGKGLPSYRPWDWICGYLMGGLVIAIMFGLAQSSYHN